MWNPARRLLALYVAVIFLSLPLLPEVVSFLRLRLGGAFDPALLGALALIALLPALRMLRAPRPAPPLPHLAYLALLAGALVTARYLASSPVGRVHLAEYALLAVLILRALPAGRPLPRHAAAFALASAVGICDELVQKLLPNRVFDLYDLALNGAAAALGLLAFAWWQWTFARSRESC